MIRATKNETIYGMLCLIIAFVVTIIASNQLSANTNTIVISQVYGAGGNSGAQYSHDFVELFNRGGDAVDLSQMSVQYGSASGDLTSVIPLQGTLAPGHYYLIKLNGNTGVGTAMPSADATGSINMSSSSGKVALVAHITPIKTVNSDQILDYLSYGAVTPDAATNFRPTLSVVLAGARSENGCKDTNDNSADFESGTPNPRNSQSPANDCGLPSSTPTSSPTPTETNTPTPTPTPTPTATATADPTATQTGTVVPSSTPSPTSTSSATSTPSPTPTLISAPPSLVINEVDADTPGSDTAEFVELFSGTPNMPLDGIVVVFMDGLTNKVTAVFSLDGKQTNSDGYFVLGNAGVTGASIVFANGTLQNGADAVALYIGTASQFEVSSLVTTTNLVDAVVYGTEDEDDEDLLILLNTAQPQVNESEGNNPSSHSSQRCPNGSGGQRNTLTFQANLPTAGMVNFCPTPTPTTAPTEAPTKIPTATKIATATKTPLPTETPFVLMVATDTPTPPAQSGGMQTEDPDLILRLSLRYFMPIIQAETGE
jgi:hypothetical protein